MAGAICCLPRPPHGRRDPLSAAAQAEGIQGARALPAQSAARPDPHTAGMIYCPPQPGLRAFEALHTASAIHCPPCLGRGPGRCPRMAGAIRCPPQPPKARCDPLPAPAWAVDLRGTLHSQHDPLSAAAQAKGIRAGVIRCLPWPPARPVQSAA